MNAGFRFLFVFVMGAANAAAFTVTTTSDSGAGSLRQAIMDANAASGASGCSSQNITFNIPGTGPHTIQPLGALPPFDAPIYLNGYSQPGAQANTLTSGDNAVITIEIDGSFAGTSNGIEVGAAAPGPAGVCGGGSSTIAGVVINRFALAGIYMAGTTCLPGQICGVGGVQIYGSFIGTDTTGTLALGNGVGLHFGEHSSSNVVGDYPLNDGGPIDPLPLTRNIIAGNLGDGIHLESPVSSVPSLGHRIRNNYIGVDATGTHALANGRYGIFGDVGSAGVKVYDNIIAAHPADGVRVVEGTIDFINVQFNAIGVGIGGVALGNAGDGVHIEGSVRGATVGGGFPYLRGMGIPSIANNTGAGMYAQDNVSVDVVAASFGSNGGHAIDLAPRGINANDPLDADTGPNELLNRPVLLTATYVGSSSPPGTVTGTLDTVPNTTGNEIDFYVSGACDASGSGTGKVFLDLTTVSTDSSGHAAFSKSLSVSPGAIITALTRRLASDSTFIVSEFSNCVTVGDLIFADGFGP